MKKMITTVILLMLSLFLKPGFSQTLTDVRMEKESYSVNQTWKVYFSTTVNQGPMSKFKVKCYYTCIGEKYINETTFTIQYNSYSKDGSFSGNTGIIADNNKVYGLPKSISSYMTMKLYRIGNKGEEVFLDSQKAYFTVAR
jgi:hypothetical protein